MRWPCQRSRHWQPAVRCYGAERNALPHARMRAIKYGQYHRDPVWARERLVTMRGPEDFVRLVDEIFADRHDEGVRRELEPEAPWCRPSRSVG